MQQLFVEYDTHTSFPLQVPARNQLIASDVFFLVAACGQRHE